MASPLEDLDELTLRCRNQNARTYITEAVYSYRAGAFRSAIVSTWIAVCFDVIEKFRELALAGDKEAEKQVHEIDATRRADDLGRALRFERELLALAKDKFELISPLEFVDLERLQQDRNRCAHPSLTSDEQAYAPSAELARLHIHTAVTHLLQHPPVQGKSALDRILKDVDSEYFPEKAQDAKVVFLSGPLRRPRDSLVRNLLVILCKSMFMENKEWRWTRRITAALVAVQELQPHTYSRTLAEKLSPLFRAVTDDAMHLQVNFLKGVPDTWQYLDADVRQRLQNYVVDLPPEEVEQLGFLLSYPELQVQARKRVRKITQEEVVSSLFFDVPKEIGDRIVSLYANSRSYQAAEILGSNLVLYSRELDVEQIGQLIIGAGKNGHVAGSHQFPALIKSLREAKKIADDKLDNLLHRNGLSHFSLSATQEQK